MQKAQDTLSKPEYWDGIWENQSAAFLAEYQADPVIDLQWALFDRFLVPDPSKKLIEIGCAHSKWLVNMRRRYGFEVHGIDYSEVGCRSMSQALAAAEFDIGGTIHCRDLLGDLDDLAGSFDYVTSFGVVEHFKDPSAILARFAMLLRPGGVVLTSIPNTAGAYFGLYRILDRSIYDMHEMIDSARLRREHESAGLQIEYCAYNGLFSPGLLTSAKPSRKRKAVLLSGRAVYRLVWPVAKRLNRHPEAGWHSPYIVCVARKPA